MGWQTTKYRKDGALVAEGDTSRAKYRVVDGVVEVWEPKANNPNAPPATSRGEPGPTKVPCAAAKQRRALPPGTWLATLVQVLSVGLVRPCTKCKSRMDRLNKLGWRGVVLGPLKWIASKFRRTEATP